MRNNACFEKCAFMFIFTKLKMCYLKMFFLITKNKKRLKKFNMYDKTLPKNASTSEAIPRIAT